MNSFPYILPGQYEIRGYTSLIQSDSSAFGTQSEKTIRKVAVGFTAHDQADVGDLQCAAGYGMQPDCIKWDEADPVPLTCLDAEEPYEIEGELRSSMIAKFNFLRTGAYLAWRLWVTGIGNQFCATSIHMAIKPKERCW
jgi:hypothetical protein